MRSKFDEQLELLHKEMIGMGSLCESAIAKATKALAEGNTQIAGQVSEMSIEIDQKERSIEAMCMKLLLQQQPVAGDLRVISSALKMVTDMERIGDNSGDIAEIVTMANISAADNTLPIQDMARATIKMVTDSIDAFVKKDVGLAKSVISYDDVVDGYFNEIKTNLIEQFGNPEADGEKILDLLMIAKYFERMGDHAAEIAKWVLYSITGNKDG
ncbi:MAG: phosphate signaling complex protein PhoU [Lachnospiraceae bacterium]|nr:phosphate signaling complex protein PhoU [Lachnospiraceae bacterium]